MKISFSYSDSKKGTLPASIIVRKVFGDVQNVIYEEKIFDDQTNVIWDELIFVVGGVEHKLSNCSNITFVIDDKRYFLVKSELTSHYELNGATYPSLKELYFRLEELFMYGAK